MKTNSTDSAYGYGFCTSDGLSHSEEKGLTKREMFAAMAMQGMLAKFGTDYQNDVIKESIYMADELIKALNSL